MQDYEYLKESMEYREFMRGNLDYLTQMGFASVEIAMEKGFLFAEFLDEVAV
jgi:hypothetical protein